MSTYTFKRVAAIVLLASVGWASFSVSSSLGSRQINRKVKSKIPPVYPELARRMNISGVVKVMITVSTNGAVPDAKVVGGHPVLANCPRSGKEVALRIRDPGVDRTGSVPF